MFRSTITLAALVAAAPALAEEPPETPRWSAGVSAGTTMLEGEGDQPFVSLSLTRDFGPAYLSLTGTLIDSGGESASAVFLPARTLSATLAAGYSFGALNLDAYASLGSREFDPALARGRQGQQLAVESRGSTAGLGLSLTYEAELGRDWMAAPFASVDYSSIDISRVVSPPDRDPVVVRGEQSGITAAAGLSLQRLFAGSSAGLYGAFVTTSNSAAQQRASSPGGGQRPLRFAQGEGSGASWAEYGATTTLALGGGVFLDASIVRTAGFPDSEITSFAAGLTVDF